MSEAYADRRKLAAWLVEWHLDCLLAAAGDEPAEVLPAERLVQGAGEVFRPGYIYLLKPVAGGTALRPRYVAVLTRRRDNVLLVAPFGRFGVPASPGEFSTGRKALHLRVLCLWNARWVRDADVPGGWEVSRLGQREWRDAMAVYECLIGGASASGLLGARVGPPVFHPGDPRHEYMDEERCWVDQCLPGLRIRCSKPRQFRYSPLASSSERLAAESRSVYRTEKKSSSRSKMRKKPQ